MRTFSLVLWLRTTSSTTAVWFLLSIIVIVVFSPTLVELICLPLSVLIGTFIYVFVHQNYNLAF
jgi:hypothetical protein